MKKSRKIVLIILAIVVIIAAAGFFYLNSKTVSFKETAEIKKWIEGDKLDTKVTDIVITKNINEEIKAKEGHSFVCITYTMKNKTDSAIEWKDFPLITLGSYKNGEAGERANKTYKTTDIDRTALKEYSYIMGVDLSAELMPIEKGDKKDDVEVYQVTDNILKNSSLFITFDIYDVGIKVEEGLSELPNLKKTLKQNEKKIKKKIKNQTIEQVEEDDNNKTQ